MHFKTMNGPGVQGLHPGDYTVKMYADETLAKYDLCQVDFDKVDTTLVTNDDPGSTNSVFYHVRIPDAVSGGVQTTRGYWYGVAQEAITSDTTGKVMFYGITRLNVHSDITEGDLILATSAIEAVEATGNLATKVIGIALTDYSTVDSCANVLFDGIHGWGMDTAVNT